MTDQPDTAGDATYRVTANELRQFVERIERLDAEKKDLADQRKDVFAEAKARGYDGPALTALIKLRAADPDKVSEFEALVEMYKQAMGMQ
ncbi:MAG: DUF2312 domain-containing protein [Sulfitobacter litoralis]|uniref:DUF2312 domain-containing protein n=1 Tax=Sulfitobacter litoralis TaxID=335975 RepID=UPI003002D3C7